MMGGNVWKPMTQNPPKSGKYLVFRRPGSYDVQNFATDLSEVDEFTHGSGWYSSLTDWGFIYPLNLVAWIELPEPPNVEDFA